MRPASLTPPRWVGCMGPMDVLAQTETTRDFGDWFLDHGLPILIVIVVAIVVTILARMAVKRFQRRLEGTASLTQEMNLQRATTLRPRSRPRWSC